MISASQLLRIDAAVCRQCNRTSRVAAVRWGFARISRLGDGVFWYVLAAALIAFDGAAALPTVLRLFAAGLCGLALYKWLKRHTLRPRPYEVVPQIEAAAPPLDQFSFPSGHTLHAVSFSLIIASSYPALAPLVFAVAALVALSRPVLGLHYPSDVIAGALIGAAVAQVALAL